MRNKIDDRLKMIANNNRMGIMTHVVVGYPSYEVTLELVCAMEKSGVDFVELQIPCSDPLADGPTIRQACEKSIASGTKIVDAFQTARELSEKVNIPLLFMAYFNTIYRYGIDRFCSEAREAGIAGVIIPDAPLEAAEHEGLLGACKENNLKYIATLAPTSSAERIKKNAEIADGFTYFMARAGVTGARKDLESNTNAHLERVRKYIKTPLAVGFGISKPEHIKALSSHADIAIVGSALINVVDKAKPGSMLKDVEDFLANLVQ